MSNGTCSGCGKPVHRRATSRERIVCRDCRRARRLRVCPECGNTFDPVLNMRKGEREQVYCSRRCGGAQRWKDEEVPA